MNLHFINENCAYLITALTSIEKTKFPLVCIVYNMLADIKQYLHTWTSTFGLKTVFCLNYKTQGMESFQIYKIFFCKFFSKLNKYLDAHPVYNFYKATHLFDLRQLPCISHDDIDSFAAIKKLQNPSTSLLKEFQIYVN